MTGRNFKKLSVESGIPEWQFKAAAGLPLKECEANTIDEAMIEFFAAQDGSEEQEAALALWVELSTTVIQVRAAYMAGLDDSRAKKAALAKWRELVIELSERATTVCQAMKLKLSSPSCNTKSEKAKLYRLTRKDKEALPKVQAAKTSEELITALKSTPIGGKAREVALQRIVEMCE